MHDTPCGSSHWSSSERLVRQASQCPFTTLLHPRHTAAPLASRAVVHKRMPHQHNLITRDVQVTLLLCVQHRDKISLPLPLRPHQTTVALRATPERRRHRCQDARAAPQASPPHSACATSGSGLGLRPARASSRPSSILLRQFRNPAFDAQWTRTMPTASESRVIRGITRSPVEGLQASFLLSQGLHQTTSQFSRQRLAAPTNASRSRRSCWVGTPPTSVLKQSPAVRAVVQG